jgi:hypothetical protein
LNFSGRLRGRLCELKELVKSISYPELSLQTPDANDVIELLPTSFKAAMKHNEGFSMQDIGHAISQVDGSPYEAVIDRFLSLIGDK